MTPFPSAYLYAARALLVASGQLPAGPPTRKQLEALALCAVEAGTVGLDEETARAWVAR